jgi:formyltetrahydrofolate hydrolase
MAAESRSDQLVLTVSCPSAAGQVAAIVGFLERHHGYIDELTVFDDDLSERFFVRCVFHAARRDESLDLAMLEREFDPIAQRFSMTWSMHDLSVRPKVLIMVSKLEHCLADLLFRWISSASARTIRILRRWPSSMVCAFIICRLPPTASLNRKRACSTCSIHRARN